MSSDKATLETQRAKPVDGEVAGREAGDPGSSPGGAPLGDAKENP